MATNLLKKVCLAPVFLLFVTSSFALTQEQEDLKKVNDMIQKNMEEQLRLERESQELQAKIQHQKRIMEAKLAQQKKILEAQKELALHQKIHSIPTAKKHEKIDRVIQDLANRLFSSSRLKKEKIESIALTSFVDLHNFNSTSHFGRTVSEAFFDELYIRGFNINDFRGQETISINEDGEYLLTRNINKLNKEITSDHALIGTYSVFERKVLLNVRVVDLMSGKVVASARANYVTVDCKVLNTCPKKRKIFIVSDKFNKEDIKKARKASYTKHMPIKQTKQYYVRRNQQADDVMAHTKTENPLVNLIK